MPTSLWGNGHSAAVSSPPRVEATGSPKALAAVGSSLKAIVLRDGHFVSNAYAFKITGNLKPHSPSSYELRRPSKNTTDKNDVQVELSTDIHFLNITKHTENLTYESTFFRAYKESITE